MLRIKDLKIKRGFTVKANATIIEAVKVLDENDCSSLVVLENIKPVGLITERDVIKKVILRSSNPEKIKTHKIMSKNLFIGNPEMEISEAARMMLIQKIDCLPIVCKEKFLGIINFSDIIRCKESLDQLKRFADSATSDEIKKAINVYFTLDNLGRKCPLMIEQGYPKKCRKAECMWWIEEECAVVVLTKKINKIRETEIINNF